MLFCISVCDVTGRAILDDDYHGEVIAVIEAPDWQAARRQALKKKEMDPFSYRAGWGWMRRGNAS